MSAGVIDWVRADKMLSFYYFMNLSLMCNVMYFIKKKKNAGLGVRKIESPLWFSHEDF